MSRSPFRRYRVLTTILGVLGIGCTDVPTTPESDSQIELPPITLDWVGYYAGSATGTIDGQLKCTVLIGDIWQICHQLRQIE